MPHGLLVTAFEPFAGARRNPSALVLESLAGAGPLATALLPVSATETPRALRRALQAHEPAGVLLLGEARGRATVCLERRARNRADYPIPDNGGARLSNVTIDPSGAAELVTSLPVEAWAAEVSSAGVPCVVSEDAGSFLCNHAYYLALAYATEHNCRALFVHLPSLREDLKDLEVAVGLDLACELAAVSRIIGYWRALIERP
jgi:pyroglutamyl-peptidase